jgi:hypothetical protein
VQGRILARVVRLTAAILFILGLSSCDLFYYPVEGRLNLLDPKNQLVWVDRIIPVDEDGYIDSLDTRYFDGPLLLSEWNPTINFASVIRFDYTELPLYVESATLEMYTTPASIGTDVEIYVIAKQWTPATLSYQSFFDGTIRDSTCPFTPLFYTLALIDGYNMVDVTNLVEYTAENPNTHGFFFAWDNGYVEFHSSRGPNPPILRVSGWDKPD